MPGLSRAQVLEWFYTYNGPSNLWDRAEKVLIDGTGGIYIMGLTDRGRGITRDWGGDIFIAKLDTLGNEKWVYTYDGLGHGYDKPSDMLLDGHGNIYIAGDAYVDSSNKTDIVAIKLDTAGNEQWAYAYDLDTPGFSVEYSNSLAFDTSGNLYVAGSVIADAIDSDATVFTVLSVDTAGVFRWWFIYPPGPRDLGSGPNADVVIADSNGEVYTCGLVQDSVAPGWYEHVFVVVKLDSLGNLVWKWWDSYECEYCDEGLIELDSSGYLYGVAMDGLDTYYFKMDTSGDIIWGYLYDEPDGAENMCLTSEGLYSCGWYFPGMPGPGEEDFMVAKVGLDGSFQWGRLFDSHGLDKGGWAWDISDNSVGDLFAVGDTENYGFAVKLTNSGAVKWAYTYPERSTFKSVAPDLSGAIYIAGAVDQDSLTREESTDILVIKLRDTVAAVTEPNPSARVPERMTLSVAPEGFLISGYEGPVQVYDATGRLILSREIEGKTLISPLKPGVYFVKAGRQRGRVAVLR